MEIKLKPCPFCGEKGRVRKYAKGYRIVCQGCGAASHYVYVQDWHDNKNIAQCQAAKAWNVRREVPNDPLTLDELREMDGEPVYMTDLTGGTLWNQWIIFKASVDGGFIPRGGGWFGVENYGKTWLAYRRRPEEA